MKRQLALIIIFSSVAGCAYAQQGEVKQESRTYSSAQRASSHAPNVYLCIDAKGNKEYTNTPAKGCKRMDLPGLTTVSAPKKSSASTANGKKSDAPNGFPKVDDKTQKSRDSDRKQILQDELKTEEEKLAKLKADYKGGEPERIGGEQNYAKYQERVAKMKEDVERAEKNVDALKREIGNLK